MKKAITLLIVVCLMVTTISFGQACPDLKETYVAQISPGMYQVVVNVFNSTSGTKSVAATAYGVGGSVVFDTCFNIRGGMTYYVSQPFYSSVSPGLIVQTFTGSNCNGTSCFTITPVKFTTFSALRSRSQVTLKWETAMEANNNGFAIERMTNGAWQEIALIPSKATNGSSDVPLSYQYLDLNNYKGITQYRIRQIDRGGKTQLSKISTVRGESQDTGMTIYPNPVSDQKLTMVFENSDCRQIKILDLQGRTVKQWNNVTNNTFSIENLNLKPGSYYVKAISPGQEINGKLIVTK